MKTIKKELILLKKSFPFIKFTFKSYSEDVQIWVNNYAYPNGYEKSTRRWRIRYVNTYVSFNKFLDSYIRGLILNDVY